MPTEMVLFENLRTQFSVNHSPHVLGNIKKGATETKRFGRTFVRTDRKLRDGVAVFEEKRVNDGGK